MKKITEKKDLALVFGITKNLIFALANVLIGVKEKSNLKPDDIIVYHDGIDEEAKKALNKILKCSFVEYKSCNCISTSGELEPEFLKKYSNMCFSRFECFSLLDEYKKIIWNDVDILIQGDLTGLLNYDDGLAMTYNDINFLVEANFNKLLDNYNMCLPLLNSGIIVFSDKLKNYKEMTKWCYDAIVKFGKDLKYLDQGILNILVQEYNINVNAIDIAKYCCHPSRINYSTAAIVHSYGDQKFWNDEGLMKKFPLWVENNIKWNTILRDTRLAIYNNDKPMLSVIMSVYNRYTYLSTAIQSILDQTFTNFELIIVVEKSDKQKEINDFIKKYQDNRIIIINNSKKLGFAESLNVGIRDARGKYIARMDDDDISLPNRFDIQYNFLENNKDIDIIGSAVKVIGTYEYSVFPETDSEKLKTNTLISNQFYHPTIMMRKSIIEKYNLYYDPNYKTEDAELWSRAVKVVKTANLRDILLHYRVCSENETQNQKFAVLNSDIQIIKKQLIDNLGLVFSDKELYILSNRVSKFAPIMNKELIDKKIKLCKIIYRQNKKVKFYNKTYLANTLEMSNPSLNVKIIIKKLLKLIFKPVYNWLINMVDNKIDENNGNLSYYIDEKCNKIENEIKK